MKPALFDYIAPTTLDQAIDILSQRGADARLLAGGQSLMPVLNFRLGQPSLLVDLNRVDGLSYIREEGRRIVIGAMTRHSEIERDDLIRHSVPLLHEATRNIAHRAIRNRGTIGGSLAQADPAAEFPATMLALGAEVVARSARGERRIAAADLFDGPLTTTLADDEILVSIEVPPAPASSGSAFVELARRHGDFALAGIAAVITMSNDAVTEARLAACGAGPGPMRLIETEQTLQRDGAGEEGIEAAARAAMAEVEPETDLHASAGYRRRIVGVLTARAITTAVGRARTASEQRT